MEAQARQIGGGQDAAAQSLFKHVFGQMAKRLGNGPARQSGQDFRAVCRYFVRNAAIARRWNVAPLDPNHLLPTANKILLAGKQ